MAQAELARATVQDLYREEGKAELIAGRIIPLKSTGRKPHRIGFRIARSLDDYAERTGIGEAYGDNMGFTLAPLASGTESFSPDAAYYVGEFPSNEMRVIEGAPIFAVQVHSANDYGSSAEIELADKRNDYFQAGTKVVWDVDSVNECIDVCRSSDSTQPTTFRRGQIADAEPAVPGWQMAVDAIFGLK